MIPFVAMRESVRDVLPWSTCARIQMLRMLSGLACRATRRDGGIEGMTTVRVEDYGGEEEEEGVLL